MSTHDIGQRIWSLCHVLRDDGITYHEYVSELTYLLFIKMMKETKREDELPKQYRWSALEAKDGIGLIDFYKQMLLDLGKAKGRIQEIYDNSSTSIKHAKNLRTLVDSASRSPSSLHLSPSDPSRAAPTSKSRTTAAERIRQPLLQVRHRTRPRLRPPRAARADL